MRRVVPLLIVLCLGFAPAPVYRPKPSAGDLKTLQGEWLLQREKVIRLWGKPESEQKWVIVNDRLSDVGPRTQRAVIDLDESSTPKRLTIHLARPLFGHSRLRAIYRLDADVLTVCYDINDWERPPASFHAGGKPNQCLLVFKRKKP